MPHVCGNLQNCLRERSRMSGWLWEVTPGRTPCVDKTSANLGGGGGGRGGWGGCTSAPGRVETRAESWVEPCADSRATGAADRGALRCAGTSTSASRFALLPGCARSSAAASSGVLEYCVPRMLCCVCTVGAPWRDPAHHQPRNLIVHCHRNSGYCH